MKIRDDYTCPLEIVHDIIKGKWKTIILYQMKDGPKGLAELEREIEGINQKMLLEQLKELIQFGLVEKKSFEGYPLRVEYSITKRRGQKGGAIIIEATVAYATICHSIRCVKFMPILSKTGNHYNWTINRLGNPCQSTTHPDKRRNRKNKRR